MITVRIEKERAGAQEEGSTNTVAEAQAELANVQEALPVLEGRAFVDRLAMPSPFQEHARTLKALATTSAKIKAAEGALIATFDRPRRRFRILRAGKAVVKERMKPSCVAICRRYLTK